MQISTENIIAKLRQSSLFEKADNNSLNKLASVMEPDSFEDKELLFKTGDNYQYSYLIIEGTVAIYRDELLMAHFKEGDLFAEFSMMEGKPYSADAEAEGEVLTVKLHHDDFYKLLEGNLNLAMSVIKDLSRRLKRHL